MEAGYPSDESPLQRYIAAAFTGERIELQQPEIEWLFLHWFDEVLPFLSDQLSAFLSERSVAPEAEDPEFEAQQAVWNALGYLAATLGQTGLAVELYRRLLQILRAEQERLGRLHKGTPYHQIGWSQLVGGAQPPSQREYFVLAAIEDFLTYGIEDGFPTTPAVTVLRRFYGYTNHSLTALYASLQSVRQLRGDVLPEIATANPEIVLLEMVPVAVIRQN